MTHFTASRFLSEARCFTNFSGRLMKSAKVIADLIQNGYQVAIAR